MRASNGCCASVTTMASRSNAGTRSRTQRLPTDVDTVRAEHDAARTLGLDVRWEESLDAPFPVHAATVLADQAQFDPMDALAALAAQLRAHGGTIHQGRRVVGVSKFGRPRVELDGGDVIHADEGRAGDGNADP